jgi:rhomboid protease GluP
MANCVRCGQSLPALTFGDLKDMCRDCQQAAAQNPPAPAPAGAHPGATVAVAGRPVTTALVAINAAVFLLMLIKGASVARPDIDQLIRWGANWGPLTLSSQPWRMLTSAFLHIGLAHLAVNMWCLWELGGLAETIFGRRALVLMYIFSAIGGSLASLAWHPQVVGAGASGAIFGIAGGLIAAFYIGKLPIPQQVIKAKLASLLIFAAFNLAWGALWTNVDNAAHLGGFAAGLLMGALLCRHLAPEQAGRRRAAYLAIALVLLTGGWAVRRSNGYIVHAQLGKQALDRNQYGVAIREFNTVLAQKPDLAEVHLMLGNAYAASQQYQRAEVSLRHAIGINPNYAVAYEKLGLVYLATNRFKPANTVLGKALALDPSLPEAQGFLAMSLEGLGQDDEAITAYRKALALNPRYSFGYARLGMLYLNHQRAPEGLAALEKAVALQPDQPEYRIMLAAAYRANGKNDEAQAALQKAEALRAKRKN